MRIREIASRVDITERAVQRIIHDLIEGDYLEVIKEGRRNHYEVELSAHLRHPLESGTTIAEILKVISAAQSS